MNIKLLRAIKETYKFLFNPLIQIYNGRLEQKLRSRLLVHDFTIISSDCIGGVISHRVGEQFNSPTVNLWMSHSDCIKLISNLKYYLSLELKFIETEYDYPVAELGDITLYFNHYESKVEAKEKWNTRKERVNYDMLYLIITAGDDLNDEQMEQIEKLNIRNKVVFVKYKREGYEFVKVMKPRMNRADGFHCMDRTLMMGWYFEKNFDYVEWLNDGMKL